jgi:hypothetical protein
MRKKERKWLSVCISYEDVRSCAIFADGVHATNRLMTTLLSFMIDFESGSS